MKYQNWKSYLSKSLLVLFIALTIALAKFINHYFPSFFRDELEPNYLIGGMIVAYGFILVLIYLLIETKYQYLLVYGLIYSISGFVIMFISSFIDAYVLKILNEWNTMKRFMIGLEGNESLGLSYFEILSILILIAHGIFKLTISDTYSKLVRGLEILVGTLFMGIGFFLIYYHYIDLSSIVYQKFPLNCIFYTLFVVVFIDLCLFGFRIIKNRKFIKDEIEEQIIESKATIRKDNEIVERKKKIKFSNEEEVIDLARYFKK